MRSWLASRCSVYLLLLLLLSNSPCVLAQLAFSNVPTTVNDGQSVQVSFTGWDGVSHIALDLVQNGAVVDEDIIDDDDAPSSTITWQVELDDDNVGGTYTLRVTSAGTTALSNPINIVDQNGVGAPASTVATPATTDTAPSSAASSGAGALPTSAVASGDSNSNSNVNSNQNNPSATPTGEVVEASASVAATATTLLTSVILGQTVTITPSSSASASSNPNLNSNSTTNAGSSSDSGSGSGSGSSLSAGAIAGIVIGILLVVALGVLGWWFHRRRSGKSRDRSQHGMFGGSEKNNANGTTKDGSYLQPAQFAAGAAGASVGALAGTGAARGLGGGRDSREPRSPDGMDGVASELHSTSTASKASELHSDSLSPGFRGAGTMRSVPAKTYEMPASFPQSHELSSQPEEAYPRSGGRGLHEAPSSDIPPTATATGGLPGVNGNTTTSPRDRSEQHNFKSPVSELSSEDTGTMTSGESTGGLISPRMSGGSGGGNGIGSGIARKAIGSLGRR